MPFRLKCDRCHESIVPIKVLVTGFCEKQEQLLVCWLPVPFFQVAQARDSREVFRVLEQEKPDIVLLGETVPQLLGMDLTEVMKKSPRLKDVPSLRFEKIGQNLNGSDGPFGWADDDTNDRGIRQDLWTAISQHIPERLLLVDDNPGSPRSHPQAEGVRESSVEARDQEALPRDSGQPDSWVPAVTADTSRHLQEEAQRFARTIVSDIILYNPEKSEEGVRTGTFEEMMREDLQEGRRLYDERITPEMTPGQDYFKGAILDFVHKRSQRGSPRVPIQ